MRLTTKLSVIITLLCALTMLLMLVGCVASFFYLSNERDEQRVARLSEEVDRALLTQTPQQIEGWLRKVMNPLHIQRIELIDRSDNRVLHINLRQVSLYDDEPNRYHYTQVALAQHADLKMRIRWVDPTRTWFASMFGTSMIIAVTTVVLIMAMLLLQAQRWLYRQLKGMERLEARAQLIICGERSSVRPGSVHEWPPKASSAIDLLLSDLREAGEQHTRIDTLIRSFAAQDSRTGLNNRLFFDNQLTTLLEDPESVGTHGMVMMIRVPDFDLLNEKWGHNALQDYLFALVNMLSTFVLRYPGALLARYFRSDFAVLLAHRSVKDADGIASQLIKAVDSLPPTRMLNRSDMIHIGISGWSSGQTTQQVMENVELATRHATLQGGNNWSVGEGASQDNSRGSVKWRTLLENTLERGGPRLYQKPAVTAQGNVHHREMMPRIFDGEKELLAAEYLPMVQQLGLAERYDRLLVTRIKALMELWEEETLAIPLTVDSILQRSFLNWLRDMLLQCTRAQRKRILFELAEADVCQHISRLQPVFHMLYGFGCSVAVNQAGLTVVSTAYISQLQVKLIKLHPGLVRNIERRMENQLFVQSLLEGCKKTGTQIFAAGVRFRQEWQTLSELGLSGGQGDFFASSQPVDRNVKKYSQRYRV